MCNVTLSIRYCIVILAMCNFATTPNKYENASIFAIRLLMCSHFTGIREHLGKNRQVHLYLGGVAVDPSRDLATLCSTTRTAIGRLLGSPLCDWMEVHVRKRGGGEGDTSSGAKMRK